MEDIFWKKLESEHFVNHIHYCISLRQCDAFIYQLAKQGGDNDEINSLRPLHLNILICEISS